jgi:hypothetical protein
VWEWDDGLKSVDGRLYFPLDNDFTLPEAQWPASSIYLDATGDPGDFDYANNAWKSTAASSTFGNLILDKRQAAAQLMIAPKLAATDASALFPEAKGGIWARNYGECLPLRGGSWLNGANAGLAALALSDRRSLVFGYGGCRPAFIL